MAIYSELGKDERWAVADYLAAERLPEIDRDYTEVHTVRSFYSIYVKRILDILLSGIALLLTLPINLIIGIITFFDVGRPIFFRQERTGRDGKPFYIIKFRNMTNERDERGDLLPASKRVTRFGRFVRKTSLDELLNFWSVFKGDMSLIGPRPLVPEYARRYSRRHRHRLDVRPGLECPPSGNESLVTWQAQFENDIWYVEHISFKTDVSLVIRLIRFALDRKNSEARANISGKGIFMGYSPEGEAINLSQIGDDVIETALRRGAPAGDR